jgi:parallel beta-helix repeat protein
MSADPQMVFLNGDYLHEVATQAEAVGTKFYYDQSNHKIIIGFDPAGKTVEVTKRPTAMFAEGFAGPVTIRGLGFAHYATDNFPEAAGFGAVIINVPGATLENNVFTEMAGGALHMADPMNAVIRGNLFLANGSMGMSANGHTKSGAVDNLLVEKNTFDTNNTERFGIGCNYSCQAAGSKMAHMNGLTLQDNVFKNNIGQAHGWWCDLDCRNNKIVRNIFQNNGGAGVYYEVSSGGIIASNLIVGNGGYGIKVGSATTKIYNNTIVGNKVGALIYDDDRTLGVGGWDDVGPDTYNVDMKNNIFSMNTSTVVQSWRTNTTAPNTGPNTFYSGYDYNSYFRNGTALNVAEWRDGTTTLYNTLSAFRTAKDKENSGQDITTGGDPFFINAAGGDYHVRPASVAYNSGTSLPADVATAIGVAASPVSRGALVWVGSGSTTTPTPPPPTPTPTGTIPTPTPTPPAVLGDLNNDGKVNVFDLSILLGRWGQNDASADINHDGIVNVFDLSVMLSRWTG